MVGRHGNGDGEAREELDPHRLPIPMARGDHHLQYVSVHDPHKDAISRAGLTFHVSFGPLVHVIVIVIFGVFLELIDLVFFLWVA